MVAACRFADGVVLISDSRATWGEGGAPTFQDNLQKIVAIGTNQVLGYAGDVEAIDTIVRQLRKRFHQDPKLQILRKVAAEIPRIAKHYYALHKSRTRRDSGVGMILTGREAGGHIGAWVFRSPDFIANRIDGYVVIGSGAPAQAFLDRSFATIEASGKTIKEKADELIPGLETELRKHGIDTVGGMFQILLITPKGVSPLDYGYIDLDPTAAPRAQSMGFGKTGWTQRDLVAKKDTPLIEPTKILSEGPHEKRLYDFKDLETPKAPKWHLNYLLTSQGVETRPTMLKFTRPMTILGTPEFPYEAELMTSVAYWGATGERSFEMALLQDSEETIVASGKVNSQFLPEDVELIFKLRLPMKKPGPAFLEARIEGQLLGRRALYFGELKGQIPEDPGARAEFTKTTNQRFLDEHAACHDAFLTKERPVLLVYFIICQIAVHGENDLAFINEFNVAYQKKFPLLLRLSIASSIRALPGKHSLRVALIDAISREEQTVNTVTIETRSSCISTPGTGEMVIAIQRPGIYFLNLYCDEQLIGTRLLTAEDNRPRFSYTLRPSDAERVENGELLVLSKRAMMAPRG